MNRSKTSKPAPNVEPSRAGSAVAQSNKPPSHRYESSPHAKTANRSAPSLPLVDDLDEFSAPPILGKTHPRHAMDQMVMTLDDSDRMFRHHPNDSIGESFSFDPDTADAAADLAADLGTEFLEGATRGQDMSDVIASESDRDEETAYLLEDFGEEGEETDLSDEDLSDEELSEEEDHEEAA